MCFPNAMVFNVTSGYWKDDISPLDDTLRVIIHDFQLMAHEVETQTNGVHAIFDFKDFEIRKMAIITPGYVKKLVNILQVFHSRISRKIINDKEDNC